VIIAKSPSREWACELVSIQSTINRLEFAGHDALAKPGRDIRSSGFASGRSKNVKFRAGPAEW